MTQSKPKPSTESGSCLCEKVKIKAALDSDKVCVCHCQMCQKWGSLFTVHAKDITFVGEENITIYNSSEWAERAFCGNCGSHLFYRLKHDPMFINFSVGLFKETAFQFTDQIFIDQKPHFFAFSNVTENLSEAQVFEKYRASTES